MDLFEKSVEMCANFFVDGLSIPNDFDRKPRKEFLHLEELDRTDKVVKANSVKNFIHYPTTFYYPEDVKSNNKSGIRQFIGQKQHILYPIGSKLILYNSPDTIPKNIPKNIYFLEENEFLKKICQDYSYLNLLEKNQITQLLPLACTAGYYELVQEFIAMDIDINKPNFNENCTALMEATKAGHVNIVRLLLSHGANVNAHSTTKNSALIYGCAGGHEEVVRILLEAGANVEHHNEDGCTPLKAAAKAGYVLIAKILLEHGATCSTFFNKFKESALTLASYKGHLEMVQLLLEADAGQKYDTNDIHLALITASIGGHFEVARLLLDAGAQANMLMGSCESPLLLAALRGHTKLAELLLDRGAEVTEINSDGYNPLMQAVRAGQMEMVTLLANRNADVNARNEKTEETALKLACCGGFFEIVDYLIKANVNIDLGQYTALMIAAREGHLNIVRYLLNCGANVHAQTFAGNTALMYACENGHTNVAKLLLSFNAKLEHKSARGVTPLMGACVSGHFDTVQFLILEGANVNCQTEDGQTPLILASITGQIAIVALLLDYGANRNYKYKDNFTTLMEATICNQQYTTTLLLDKSQIFRTNKYRYGIDNELILRNYYFSQKNMVEKIYQWIYKKHSQVLDQVLKMICKNEEIKITFIHEIVYSTFYQHKLQEYRQLLNNKLQRNKNLEKKWRRKWYEIRMENFR